MRSTLSQVEVSGNPGAVQIVNTASARRLLSPAIAAALSSAIVMDYNTDGYQDVLINVGGLWSLAKSTRQGLDPAVNLCFAVGADSRAISLKLRS